jgi:putative salt-induced outer membrane protein
MRALYRRAAVAHELIRDDFLFAAPIEKEGTTMKPCLVALLLIAAAPVFAQPAPPAPPAPAAPPAAGAAPAAADPLTGEVALGYLSTKGNTDSTNANATFALKYTLEHWAHNVDLLAIGATTDNVTTAEAYSAKYKAKRAFGADGKSYLFAALDWSHDRFSAYDEQISESVGYGRVLIDRGRSVLNGELGAGARQSTLIDQTKEDEGILRAALDYELKLTDMTGFKQSLVIESGSSNTTTEAISALRARLVGNVGLVLSYRIKSNTDVPVGIEKTDRFTSIALSYAF